MTYSLSKSATVHLYCAVENKHISANCRTVNTLENNSFNYKLKQINNICDPSKQKQPFGCTLTNPPHVTPLRPGSTFIDVQPSNSRPQFKQRENETMEGFMRSGAFCQSNQGLRRGNSSAETGPSAQFQLQVGVIIYTAHGLICQCTLVEML